MSAGADAVRRAMGNDGAFRVIVARTSATVSAAIAAQQAHGLLACQLGELLTGAVLFRETLAPDLRVQAVLEGGGGGRLIADAHPDGGTRGIARGADGAGQGLTLAGATLRVARALPRGALHEGVVAVGGAASIAQALMTYLQDSEQIVSVLEVATRPIENGSGSTRAAGFLVQLLPEARREALAAMVARLESGATLEPLLAGDGEIGDVLGRLFGEQAYTELDASAVRFACRCTQERVEAALLTLPAADLEGPADGGPLVIHCDYCARRYEVGRERLRALGRDRS